MQRATTSRGVRRVDLLTIALFVGALVAPHVDEAVRDVEARGPARHENRNPAEWPGPVRSRAALHAWTAGVERWYEDRMGLRDVLLRGKSTVRLLGFGVSPADVVLPGRAGFLFYTGDHTLAIHRGLRPFSAGELEDWRRMLEARDAFCRAHGARYLFVVGPDKEGVYPDLLPAWFEQLGPTRCEQLREHLARANSPVELLDLHAPMRAARALERPRLRLYSELGTHWDGLGAWVAYHAFAARLARDFPAVRPLGWEELVHDPREENPDSWARRMYVEDLLDPHCTLVRFPEALSRRRVLLRESGPGTRSKSVVDDPRLPRVVFFHDSFGQVVDDLIAEHASSFTGVFATRFDTERIVASRAQVVVDWYVERVLDAWTPATEPPPAEPAPEGEVLWRLDPARAEQDLRSIGGTTVRVLPEADAAVEVGIGSTADLLELPRVAPGSARGLVLRADVEAPAATDFDLYFRLPEEADYRRRDVRSAPLAAGGDRVELPLDPAWLAAPLRFRPGRVPGAYRITRLEIGVEPVRAPAPGAPGARRKE